MKKCWLGAVVALLIVCLTAVTGCSGAKDTVLAVPEPTIVGNVVTWAPIEHAERYEVSVNGTAHTVTDPTFTVAEEEPGAYSITVTAVTSQSGYASSAPSQAVVYTVSELAAPEVSIEAKTISWSAVPGAAAYEIFAEYAGGGNVLVDTVTATSYELAFEAIGTYTVTVAATGGVGYARSPLSNAIEYRLEVTELAAPVISLAGDAVTWFAIDYATAYEVYVGGTLATTVTETRYAVPFTATGVYEIVVKAVREGAETIRSAESNAVSYINRVDLAEPLRLVSAATRKSAVLAEGSLPCLTQSTADEADTLPILTEATDGGYRLRLTDGKYLCYATVNGRGYVFADILDEADNAFLWTLTPVEGTADRFRIGNAKASEALAAGESCLAVGSDHLGFVKRATYPGAAEDLVWVVRASDATAADFAQRAVAAPFDIAKPLIAQFATLSATDNILGIREGYAAKPKLENYLAENIPYSKYLAPAGYASSAFKLEKIEGYTTVKNGVYDFDDDALYRIRLADGRYLGVTKGLYVDSNGSDFISAGALNAYDYWQIWTVEFLNAEKSEIMLQNIGFYYDWWGKQNVYLSNMNRLEGDVRLWDFDPEKPEYFTLKLRNIDVAFAPPCERTFTGAVNLVNAADDKMYKLSDAVSAAGAADYYLSAGDDYAAGAAESYGWEPERVEIEGLSNTFRFRSSATGKYLSYLWYDWGYNATDLNEDLTTDAGKNQVFILMPVSGVRDAFRIGNPYMGEPDNDGVFRPYVLQNDPGAGRVLRNYGNMNARAELSQIWYVKDVVS